MKLKKYLDFLKESKKYQFGCIKIDVKIPNWKDLTKSIEKEDVYIDKEDPTYGIEENPHLTLLYPVLDDVKWEIVQRELEKLVKNKIDLKINGQDFFESEKFDVVKLNVEPTPYLNKIHNYLKKNIPNDFRFPTYHPHVTVSFVKKGMGKKYKKDFKLTINNIDRIKYNTKEGKEFTFEIK